MKKTAILLMSSVVMTFASVSYADHNYHHGHGGHYGHGHHGHDHRRDDKWDDGDTALAASFGASLLSLTIDSATKEDHAMLQQAETEALAYSEETETTEVFQSAKEVFERNGGKTLSDAQAAEMIVEYNQTVRGQL